MIKKLLVMSAMLSTNYTISYSYAQGKLPTLSQMHPSQGHSQVSSKVIEKDVSEILELFYKIGINKDIIKQASLNELPQLERGLNPEITQLKNELISKKTQRENELNTEIAQLENDLNTQKSQIESEFNSKTARLKMNANSQIVQLKTNPNSKKGKLKKDPNTQKAQIERDLNSQIARLKKDLNSKITQLESELNFKISQKAQLEIDFNSQMDELIQIENELNSEIAKIEIETLYKSAHLKLLLLKDSLNHISDDSIKKLAGNAQITQLKKYIQEYEIQVDLSILINESDIQTKEEMAFIFTK